MNLIKKIGLSRLIVSIVLLALIGSFIFRRQIKEHKVSKAKMEMLKRMTESKPQDWTKEFRQVYDSMVIGKKETLPKDDK